jgi:polyferredoxin
MILDSNAISNITSLIQVSVAPVFLIAGVAGLLNVFTGRLSRIIDKLERLDAYISDEEKKDSNFILDEKLTKRRRFLVMRMQNTNKAIFFCTATGFMIALVILTIFASSLISLDAHFIISILFIISMACLIIALLLFLREIYYTTSFIKVKRNNIDLK